MSGTEQRGVCAGGKKPTARSINRILKLFESFKIRTAGRKYFFDTLRGGLYIRPYRSALWGGLAEIAAAHGRIYNAPLHPSRLVLEALHGGGDSAAAGDELRGALAVDGH